MGSTDGSLTVLGSAGGFPVAGLACSGYLAQLGGLSVLLDCGPGVAAALIGADSRADIEAIVISHLHPDHVLDLIPIAYSLLAEWLLGERGDPVPVYMPPGGTAFLTRLSDLFDHRNWRFPEGGGSSGQQRIASALARGEDWLLTVFDLHEYMPGDALGLGAVTIATYPADHGIPTAAMRLGAADADLVYTADTRFSPGMADFAQGAGLLLADAHLSGPRAPGGAHMSPTESGRLAARANVRRLVLCHLAAPEDGRSALADAAAEFAGPIFLACDTRTYRL